MSDLERRASIAKDSEKGESATEIQRVEDAAHYGVQAVEASHKVYGKYSKWILFISLGLAAYIYSLDGTTTYYYLSHGTSAFGRHSFLSTVQVAQGIIVAVGKPIIAKVADIRSRGLAFVLVLIFYVVGYIIIASSKNVETIAGGIILYAVGYTGLQVLLQIIVADMTTLRWRGLVSGMISMPFIINAFVGANVAEGVLNGAGWRWGYGMFAILIPATLSPLVATLLWAEWRAKKLGIVGNPQKIDDDESTSGLTLVQKVNTFPKRAYGKVYEFLSRLDAFGLLLLGTAVSLILLPLTLARTTAKDGWHNPSMIAMIVIGCILVPVYAVWDTKFAKYPVIPIRFIRNRSIFFAALIGAFDFISFYISFSYLYSFIYIVKPWSEVNINYFNQTQTVALTVFGIAAGAALIYIRRAKYLMIAGLSIRLLGCGLMIHSRGANASDAEVVWSQLLQGIGGGIAAVTIQVSAQASAPHADVGMATAVVLLITEIGGAIGSAIAGAIWTGLMPGRLAVHLPFVDEETLALLYGSLGAIAFMERDNPIRVGATAAYDDVMKSMTIAATAFSVVPIILAFFIPNWYLGDQQNAVENVDLKGEKAENPDVIAQRS